MHLKLIQQSAMPVMVTSHCEVRGVRYYSLFWSDQSYSLEDEMTMRTRYKELREHYLKSKQVKIEY